MNDSEKDILISYLMRKGYPEKCTKTIRSLFIVSHINLSTFIRGTEEKERYFLNKGISIEQFRNMVMLCTEIILRTPESLDQKERYFLKKNITPEQFLKIIIRFPAIYTYAQNRLNLTEQYFRSRVFTPEQFMRMVVVHPPLYSYSLESLLQKEDLFFNMSYSEEELRKIAVEFPAIYGSSIENIARKLEYYNEIELKPFIIENPKNLMQSVNLTYARYNFLVSNGIYVGSHNFGLLFMGNEPFKKQFGIGRSGLLELYPYCPDAPAPKLTLTFKPGPR